MHMELVECTLIGFRKVVSTNTPWPLQLAYEGEIGRLCSVTLCKKVDFLISNSCGNTPDLWYV